MTAKPVRLNAAGEPSSGMMPSDMIATEAFTTSDQTELISNHYTSDDQRVLTGVWECAPCRGQIDAYPAHEMMVILAGSMTVIDTDGNTETYEAGDTFFVPKGAPFTWEVNRPLRKFYMIANV